MHQHIPMCNFTYWEARLEQKQETLVSLLCWVFVELRHQLVTITWHLCSARRAAVTGWEGKPDAVVEQPASSCLIKGTSI